MHKSVLTFGLLASTLVMLAIMPLLNQNNFLNATAQEYYKYGDSSYSTYQTDDKKYECRTGQFEGFFVSSVEFCKHVKFNDNKRDTKTGPQGPPGPPGTNGTNGEQGPRGFNGTNGAQGPAGPQGIQGSIGLTGPTGANSTVPGPEGQTGPADPNQILNSSVYPVNGIVDNTSGDGIAVSIATCNSGDTVLSGSVSFLTQPEDADIIQDFPVTTGNAWQAQALSGTSLSVQIQATAWCFNNPP